MELPDLIAAHEAGELTDDQLVEEVTKLVDGKIEQGLLILNQLRSANGLPAKRAEDFDLPPARDPFPWET